MTRDRVYLSEEEISHFVPYLDLYILDKILRKDLVRPLVLICPGGGYFFCNPRETESIALALNAVGFNVAVLYYSTEKETHYPKQFIEAAKAMEYLKMNAKEFSSDPEKVYALGFSAGGHLVACLGTLWNKEPSVQGIDCRPRGVLLSYAVTLSGEFENKTTIDNLCGDDAALRKKISLEDKVDCETPSFFIWHTYEDSLVPVENALFFASSLRRNKVPFELHIYQRGPHALSLGEDFTSETPDQINRHAASWIRLAISWIRNDFVE